MKKLQNILDVAAQFSSTAHEAANQEWSSEESLVKYLLSDHISKRNHKKFLAAIKPPATQKAPQKPSTSPTSKPNTNNAKQSSGAGKAEQAAKTTKKTPVPAPKQNKPKAETGVQLVNRLKKEKATDEQKLKAWTNHYKGKSTDEKFIKQRMKIYEKIAEKNKAY